MKRIKEIRRTTLGSLPCQNIFIIYFTPHDQHTNILKQNIIILVFRLKKPQSLQELESRFKII